MKLFLIALLLVAGPALAAEFKPGQVLVRWKAGPSQAALDSAAVGLGLAPGASADLVQRTLRSHWGMDQKRRIEVLRTETWSFDVARSVTHLVKTLGEHPLVEYAEPNYLYHASGPADQYIANQWYYSQIGASQAFDAWKAGSITLTANVKVAVLDSGIDRDQSQISPQLDQANAKNFYVGVGETWYKDDSGHGTFVAGIIAATTEDTPSGTGVAGVFFATSPTSKISILPVKVLGGPDGSGSLDEIAAGIVYAVGQGAKILNMSLGSNVDSVTFQNAVELALLQGSMIVAAAGNEGGAVSYPAAYPNVLAVGALTSANVRTFYSNFGDLDISAPGGDGGNCGCPMYSGVPDPGACCWAAPQSCWATEIVSLASSVAWDCLADERYSAGAGTSFAAPMVAAAAALLLSQDPTRGPSDLVRILTQSADATAHGVGYNEQAGWGRLNIYKALTGDTYHASLKAQPIKAYNWPNPFNPERDAYTTIQVLLEQSQALRLAVYDQGGDQIFSRDVESAQVVPGMNAFTWDGRNENGKMVSNGSYLLAVEAGGSRTTHWIAVVQ